MCESEAPQGFPLKVKGIKRLSDHGNSRHSLVFQIFDHHFDTGNIFPPGNMCNTLVEVFLNPVSSIYKDAATICLYIAHAHINYEKDLWESNGLLLAFVMIKMASVANFIQNVH